MRLDRLVEAHPAAAVLLLAPTTSAVSSAPTARVASPAGRLPAGLDAAQSHSRSPSAARRAAARPGRRPAARRAEEPRREHAGVVDHQEVAGRAAAPAGRAIAAMTRAAAAAIEHQQPALAARRGLLRDPLGGQLEVEVANQHGGAAYCGGESRAGRAPADPSGRAAPRRPGRRRRRSPPARGRERARPTGGGRDLAAVGDQVAPRRRRSRHARARGRRAPLRWSTAARIASEASMATGAATLGSRCRVARRARPTPSTRAARTKSDDRRRRVSERTSRAGAGIQPVSPRIRIVVPAPAGTIATIATSRKRRGKACAASIAANRARPPRPPASPEARPTGMPIASDRATAAAATASETRPPWSTRARRSRPSVSLPSQKRLLPVGARSPPARSRSFGRRPAARAARRRRPASPVRAASS